MVLSCLKIYSIIGNTCNDSKLIVLRKLNYIKKSFDVTRHFEDLPSRAWGIHKQLRLSTWDKLSFPHMI